MDVAGEVGKKRYDEGVKWGGGEGVLSISGVAVLVGVLERGVWSGGVVVMVYWGCGVVYLWWCSVVVVGY